MSRRHVRALVTAAALLFAVTACSVAAPQQDQSTAPALPRGLNPEPGTDIPRKELKVGFTPYGDELIGVIGARQGWFENAGITFTQPDGLQTDLAKSLTPVLEGQVQVGSSYMPAIVPQLDTVSNVRAFMVSNVFMGNRILAPKGRYQTVDALMAQGQTFQQAASTVMAQLKGKTLLLPDGTAPTFYTLSLKQAGLTLDDVKAVRLSEPDIIRSAQAGQDVFAAPEGAVGQTQLQEAGWEPLITVGQIIKALPPDQTLELRNAHSVYVTTTQFAEANYNTLLRFSGVLYRIIDQLEKDPQKAAAQYTDYVNSYTGSNLTVAQTASMFSNGLYSLRGFDQAGQFLTDTNDPSNLDRTVAARIANLKAGGALVRDHSPSEVSIATQVYEDLRAYRTATDGLLAQLPDGTQKARAQELYAQFDYLDAYRVALAAKAAS
ncbi:hypothetical protein GCM10009836_12160 [Pseudonocardia ailaonensis]|uniref:SsuA/THI5-like domain-containing protein n=1 Tax=Pseudonocardia ailaonensis TaxID=367279 RepID=A0ABN2MRA3_9PSEU